LTVDAPGRDLLRVTTSFAGLEWPITTTTVTIAAPVAVGTPSVTPVPQTTTKAETTQTDK
jgi:hypothetical protein